MASVCLCCLLRCTLPHGHYSPKHTGSSMLCTMLSHNASQCLEKPVIELKAMAFQLWVHGPHWEVWTNLGKDGKAWKESKEKKSTNQITQIFIYFNLQMVFKWRCSVLTRKLTHSGYPTFLKHTWTHQCTATAIIHYIPCRTGTWCVAYLGEKCTKVKPLARCNCTCSNYFLLTVINTLIERDRGSVTACILSVSSSHKIC